MLKSEIESFPKGNSSAPGRVTWQSENRFHYLKVRPALNSLTWQEYYVNTQGAYIDKQASTVAREAVPTQYRPGYPSLCAQLYSNVLHDLPRVQQGQTYFQKMFFTSSIQTFSAFRKGGGRLTHINPDIMSFIRHFRTHTWNIWWKWQKRVDKNCFAKDCHSFALAPHWPEQHPYIL